MFELTKKEKKGEVVRAMSEVEFQLCVPNNETALTEYQKFPLANIGAFGLTTLEPILNALNKQKQKGAGETLYRAILPRGTHLAKKRGENAFLGTAIRDGEGIVKQARFKPVSSTGVSNVPPVNPVMICMAVILMTVTKKLDEVKETGEQVLAFLEEKERAKLEGNLETLTEIFNNYKYNIDNQLYKTNKHIQVQAVKSEAEQSIKLYRSQVEKELKKQSFFHGDHSVQEKISQIESKYRNYQLALYAYSFAYFLEVMLFENFERGYLQNVQNILERHCEDYQALHQKSRLMIEEYSKTSMQTYAVKALSGISKGTGKVFAKIPLINKTQVDENLIAKGEELQISGEERTVRVMDKVFAGNTNFVTPFMENIRTVDSLYNDSLEVLVDKDTLYIKNA